MLTEIHQDVSVVLYGGLDMDIHDNIKNLREQRGWSQEILADKVGYKDRSSIAKIEAGLVDLSQSKVVAFAKAFGVTPAMLMGIADTPSPAASNIIPVPKTYKVPLLGTIACGEPILAVENLDGKVDVPESIHADFALRCKGDSMINARIYDGDIVYIRKQDTVENGEIAAVLIGDEATLKRVKALEDRIILEPANPMYDPLVYRSSETEEVRILGKAVAFTSFVR